MEVLSLCAREKPGVFAYPPLSLPCIRAALGVVPLLLSCAREIASKCL